MIGRRALLLMALTSKAFGVGLVLLVQMHRILYS
jgi:hypothetical protein